jgi:hypothetical protein
MGEHTEVIGEMRHAFMTSAGKPEGKRPLDGCML